MLDAYLEENRKRQIQGKLSRVTVRDNTDFIFIYIYVCIAILSKKIY